MTFPQIRSIEELLLSKQHGLACDLDETCCDTVFYWITKMQKIFGNPENLVAEKMVEKYQYVQNVPYWQTPEAEAWVKEDLVS
ncbi:MAG: hypothetical protein AABX04_07395, partial [Nanoarchaeota archaeon]